VAFRGTWVRAVFLGFSQPQELCLVRAQLGDGAALPHKAVQYVKGTEKNQAASWCNKSTKPATF